MNEDGRHVLYYYINIYCNLKAGTSSFKVNAFTSGAGRH